MTARAMDKVGAADVAEGQVWAAPPGGSNAGRPAHRSLWQVAALDHDGVTVTDGTQHVDVSFGTLLAEWTLVEERP